MIATGAAAMGQEVSMFFTFWGLNALRKDRQVPVSKMNYFGAGAKMLRSMMKEKNVSSLEEMMSLARDTGVRMIACEMSRDVMGIGDSELMGVPSAAASQPFLPVR